MNTKESVLILKSLDSNLKAVDIARLVGVTRERVRQCLKKLDLPTRLPAMKHYCKICREEFVPNYNQGRVCHKCVLQRRTEHYPELICLNCGNKFHRYRSAIQRSKNIFCSTHCRAAYAIKIGGYHKASPEVMRIRELFKANPRSVMQLSQEENIDYEQVRAALAKTPEYRTSEFFHTRRKIKHRGNRNKI